LKYVDPTGEMAITIPVAAGAAAAAGLCIISGACERFIDACGNLVDSYMNDPLLSESRDKSRHSKPKDAPSGTRPIDKIKDLSKDDIHGIKDGVGAGPKDWTGITPDGDVITSNTDGTAENHGPYIDYLP
jgi:hypothetical protein